MPSSPTWPRLNTVVVVCVLSLILTAGCGDTTPPRTASSVGTASSTSSASAPSANATAISAARLRAALLTRFEGAVPDGNAALSGENDPVASGRYGSLRHPATQRAVMTPRECANFDTEITPDKAPAAPAAAIILRKSDLELASELLIALPTADIDTELRHRVPEECRHVRLLGVQPAVIAEISVNGVSGGARAVTIEIVGKPRLSTTTATCTIAFRTGGGHVLARVGYTASSISRACRMATDFARAAARKTEHL